MIVACDGEEGIALARTHKPRIVITDVVMPRMDGYDLCRNIRAEPELANVPVILLTALSDPRDVIGALQCGADGFITKPHNEASLASGIEDLIARREQPEDERGDGAFEMQFAGEKHVLKGNARQITSLLLSTYDHALRQKLEIERTNKALLKAREELRQTNRQLMQKQDRLDEDLKAAAGIQRSLLPKDVSVSPSLEVAWKFRPCELIGGDIFNLARLDERHYAFYMLDVSGHGVPAALVTVSVSQTLHPNGAALVKRPKDGLTHEIVSPREVLKHLDREYPIERFQKFFTIAYLLIDVKDGTLQYSSAGHPPPLLLRADGTLQGLDKGGGVVGLGCDGIPFEEGAESLQSGDRIILYTDGVLEHENAQRDCYGQKRLQQSLEDNAGLELDEILESLMEDVMAFGQHPPKDDVSLLGIAYTG